MITYDGLVQDWHNSSANARQFCTKPLTHGYHDSEYILDFAYLFWSNENWDSSSSVMPTLSSLAVPEFFITTSTSAASDNKVGIMIFPGSLAMMQ